jgi:hypothetical protein
MFKTLEGSTLTGSFKVAGADISGELTIDRTRTSLYLWSSEFFHLSEDARHCVHGVLRDRSRVSLLECVPFGTGTAGAKGERYHFAEVFPHYVVVGNSHMGATAQTICKVNFLVSDAAALFHDYGAFRLKFDTGGWVEQIAKADDSEIDIGSDPMIGYFTGKYQIVSAATAVATISASHRPTFSFGGGPDGLSIENSIWVTLAFEMPIAFTEAIAHAWDVINFMELLIGRRQEVERLTVQPDTETEEWPSLEVYWSHRPQGPTDDKTRRPHPTSVLIAAADEKEEFCTVVRGWLDLQQSRRLARHRFFDSLLRDAYDVDLVIRAANMFDILPESAVPSEQELSDEWRAAQKACREIVDQLPESIESQRIRTALGSIGRKNLKQKVRHRAKQVIDAFAPRLSDLGVVIDEAVNCRNYYVHGGDPRFDYNTEFRAMAFLCDTLVFVFGMSELIDSGWSPKSWLGRSGVQSHPFVAYLIGYNANLAHLRTLLP